MAFVVDEAYLPAVLTSDMIERFWHLCPEFSVEVRFPYRPGGRCAEVLDLQPMTN